MRFIIFSILSILSIAAHAQMRSADQVASEIAGTSPRLKYLRSASEAEAAKAKSESNLPDPEIEGEFLAAPAGEQNRWGAGVSWGLEWPGVYSTRKNINSLYVESREQQAKGEERELQIQVRQLLLDYILQTKQMDVMQEMLSTTDSIFSTMEKAVAGGEMTRLDINKLAIEKAGLESRIATLSDERNETLGAVSSLAGRDMTETLGSMIIEFPDLILPAESELKDLSNKNPEIHRAEVDLKIAQSSRSLAKRESLPGISIGYKHAFEDGNHFNGGNLGLTLPIFSNRGKKRAAEASVKMAEIDLENRKNEYAAEIVTSLRRVALLKKEIEKISSAIEITDNQTLLINAYNNRVITMIDYLNERNYFLDATLSLLELRHKASSALLPILPF